MQLLEPANVRQYAKQGVDFQSNLERGNLAQAPFVNDVCSAIKAVPVPYSPAKGIFS